MIRPANDAGRALMTQVTLAASVEDAVVQVFAPDGPLVRGGYAPRTGQVEMARLVARSIDSGGQTWRAVQAPTGTGKGISYLVPGVLATIRAWTLGQQHKPLLVSTASIPLQTQLARKDVPGIAAALGIELHAVVRKGIGNYACRDKLYGEAMLDLGGNQRGSLATQLTGLFDSQTWNGDKDDLPFDPGPSWGDVSVSSDSCLGEKCQYMKDGTCTAAVARAGTKEAHVVVVNHHVLALSGAKYDPVLVAIDEGHEFEEALRSVGGAQFTRWSLRNVAKSIRASLGEQAERGVDRAMESLARSLESVVAGSREDRVLVTPGSLSFGEAPASLAKVARAMQGAAEAQDGQTQARWEKAAERINKVVRIADMLSAADAGNAVLLVEQDGAYQDGRKKVTARVVPVDVAKGAAMVTSRHGAAVLTSATLSPTGSFEPLSAGLGIAFAEVLDLPSPFDLSNMGLTIAPEDTAPSPKDAYSWEPWACARTVDLVRHSKGGALVLCSSFKMVKQISTALRGAGIRGRDGSPVTIRCQGEAGRSELRSWFASDHDGVLVAAKSFATGLDVQGDACRLVVIDKPPFPTPKDPIEEAVGNLLAGRTGKSSFMARAVPRAAAGLAQACGRLIRSPTDRGVIAVLDRRVFDGGQMGAALKAAIPPFPVSRDANDVLRFFGGVPVEGVVADVGTASEGVRVTGGAVLARRVARSK